MRRPIETHASPGDELQAYRPQCSQMTADGNVCKAPVYWIVLTKENTKHPMCISHKNQLRNKGFIVNKRAND